MVCWFELPSSYLYERETTQGGHPLRIPHREGLRPSGLAKTGEKGIQGDGASTTRQVVEVNKRVSECH